MIEARLEFNGRQSRPGERWRASCPWSSIGPDSRSFALGRTGSTLHGACAWPPIENAATVDEFAHLPAGVSHWERGRFTLYHENPPFVRALIALPVWLSGPKTDYRRERIGLGIRSEWRVGQNFNTFANAERPDLLGSDEAGAIYGAHALRFHGQAARLRKRSRASLRHRPAGSSPIR